MPQQDFLNGIENAAKSLWSSHQVLPSIAAAQTAQETGFGEDSTLAGEYNNYFGIKSGGNCTNDQAGQEPTGREEDAWEGAAVCAWTWEHEDGVDVETVEPFRVYESVEDSFQDYGEFLQQERYTNVIGEENYETAANALQEAGYATDPNYANSLITLIEEYGLEEWDQEVLNDDDDNGDNGININIVDPNLEFTVELTSLSSDVIEYIFIHHPAASSYSIYQVHEQHLEQVDDEGNSWGGIGYNYYIHKDDGGDVYIGRGLNQGAHVIGYNSISLGVCLEGDYSSEEVADVDWNILATFVLQLMDEHGVTVENVLGHQEANGTECPGANFDMDDFRATLETGEIPDPDPDPDPDPGDPTTYTVQSGDTLTSIAAEFDVTVDQLVEWNNLSDPDNIQIGQELIVADSGNGGTPDPGPGPDDSVEAIQEWLNTNYNSGLEVDGIFGAATNEAVVSAVQTELNSQFGAGLAVDGSFGPLTQLAWPYQLNGDTGNLVYLIQAQIIGAGYDPNGFDGIFGDGLESAVTQFQTDEGIAVDSIVGVETAYALFNHTQGWHWDWIPNPDITEVQQWLNNNYSSGLVLDGSSGPNTREALVRAVQTQLNADYNAGLVVDGIFGPATQSAWQFLQQGDTGNLVQLVQGRLISAGYDPQGFDGSFGPGMEAAVRAFQTNQGIAIDGIVGAETSYTLFNF